MTGWRGCTSFGLREPMAAQRSDKSVLGPGTRVTGRVVGRGAISVEGTVEGELRIAGPCTIARGATVQGDVEVDSLEVAGSLIGDAVARDRVVVASTADVRGSWRAAEVTIEPGARVSLRLDAEFELGF